MRVLKAQRCVKRFRALCGFTSPRGKAMRLPLLYMGKLSHTCRMMLQASKPPRKDSNPKLPLSLPVWPELCPFPAAAIPKAFMARLLCTQRHKHRPT